MKNTKAETILEVMVALSVLMITLSYIGGTLTTSIRLSKFSENRLIAESLAIEGIEGVKNIIYSNLFRLDEDKENCWNAGFKGIFPNIEPVSDITECKGLNALKIGDPNNSTSWQYFKIVKQDEGWFYLDPLLSAIFTESGGTFSDNLTDNCANAPCYVNPASTSAAEYRLFKNGGFYTHDASGTSTNFFRTIGIKYIDAFSMQIASVVAFKDAGNYSYVIKNDVFKNYYKK